MPLDIVYRAAQAGDLDQIEALHDRVFGPGALTRSAYRLREGVPRLSPFCRVAVLPEGVIASVRFTPITIGGRGGALLLGPLAVDAAHANRGHGRRIVRDGLTAARTAGIRLAVLVGDLGYYASMGFSSVPRGTIAMPGPVDLDRLLANELVPAAAGAFAGTIAADRDGCY